MNLDELAVDLHEVSISNGFYEGPLTWDKIFGKIAFFGEEQGELIHALKKEEGPQAVTDEAVDLIIRVLDLHEALRRAGLADDSINDRLFAKHEKNKGRGYLHGKVAG